MRYLGIDFGSKKVGLAISDEMGKVAFPLLVLKNDKNLLTQSEEICSDKKIDKIVCGLSLNSSGNENDIMKETKIFCQQLSARVNLSLDYENEFMTSVFAGETLGRDEKLDARAAALILQRYLDRLNNQ